MKSIAFVAATLLTAASALHPSRVMHLHPRATKAKGNQEPSAPPTLGAAVSQGCFSSKGDLVLNSTLRYNTKGSCAMDICNKILGKPVGATSAGNQCLCGSTYPPANTRVDDENCNIGCTGYDIEACGGVKFYSVYNTGFSLDVESAGGDDAKASGTDTGKPKPTQTAVEPPKQTIIINNSTQADDGSSQGSNTAGIAAGVVVSIVAVAAAAVGIFMYLKKKKNREIEEEHRRNAAVNSFMGKPPSSSGMSITDSRLDPVMAQRRMSDGSIADNQDYSRRILRVTNA